MMMIKSKLAIHTLSGCKKCENLKEILNLEGISYEEVVCDSRANSVKCDQIELDIDCSFYPIAIITKKVEKDRGGYYVYADEKLIIHFCTKYDDFMIKRKINNESYAMCVLSSADMVELIKKNN